MQGESPPVLVKELHIQTYSRTSVCGRLLRCRLQKRPHLLKKKQEEKKTKNNKKQQQKTTTTKNKTKNKQTKKQQQKTKKQTTNPYLPYLTFFGVVTLNTHFFYLALLNM